MAALRTCLATVPSDSSVLSESMGSECVLIRAVRDGVWMFSSVRVPCRLSTFSWIGIAFESNPVSARHFMGPSSRKVGPDVWWKNDVLMSLSNGSRVRITRAGIVWIEVMLASFSALFVAVWNIFIIFVHSLWRWRLSS